MSIKLSAIKEIAHKYSTFFFDLDGVIVSNSVFSGKDQNQLKAECRL